MAETKILNLDAILAEQERRVVIWNGTEHEIVGLTGAAYLKFLLSRKKLEKAQKDGDEAAQWDRNLDIITLVVPGIERDALLALRLAVLNQLAQFVMAEFSNMAAEAQGEGAGEGQELGESISPA